MNYSHSILFQAWVYKVGRILASQLQSREDPGFLASKQGGSWPPSYKVGRILASQLQSREDIRLPATE